MIDFDISNIEKIKELCQVLNIKKLGIELNPTFDTIFQVAKLGLWPPAVADNMIVRTEAQKQIRANSITTSMLGVVKGKKCLDFGCGEGHIVREIRKREGIAFGYDPQAPTGEWFSTNWDEIKTYGPFDLILAYDVMDHIPRAGWLRTLEQIRDVCTKDTDLRFRFHPYTAIHGTHAYNSLNLAFIHLCLTDMQIRSLGGKLERVAPIHTPLATYKEMLTKAGFTICKQTLSTTEIPAFFKTSELHSHLLSHFREWGVNDSTRMYQIMAISFVDCVIKRA